MPKTRFSATDVQAMVRDLRAQCLGMRVANVYDLDSKTYLFKLAVPGRDKIILLMESGTRFHSTKYARDKSDLPSGFSMKLRKHLRTKRLDDIRQLGMDRVVDFKFGSGESAHHVILELYASGNIILTDQHYEILALLRTHSYEQDVSVQVREIYPVTHATTFDEENGGILGMEASDVEAWLSSKVEEVMKVHDTNDNAEASEKAVASEDLTTAHSKKGGGKKGNKQHQSGSLAKQAKKPKVTLRQVLLSKDSGVSTFGPEIVDHVLVTSDLKPNMKMDIPLGLTPEQVLSLVNGLRGASAVLASLNTPGSPGYIILEDKAQSKSGEAKDSSDSDIFSEFVPMLLAQHSRAVNDDRIREFRSFDEAVDEYFCKIEEQKLQKSATAAEEQAQRRIDKFKDEQEGRRKQLEGMQSNMNAQADLVELYADDVDKVILVLNSALANGMSWEQIDAMIEAEKNNGNPIASLVSSTNFPENKCTLVLVDLYCEDDDTLDDGDIAIRKGMQVEIDLSMSAFSNVRLMHETKKKAREKELKTIQASERALEKIEASTVKQLQQQKLKRNLQALRKVLWFEKFNWFLTSEGYLVLSGRDAQQNELLVKRYLKPGDAYVHADLHGSSSCIVKSKAVEGEQGRLSQLAIQEAGIMCVCRSHAWSAKVVTSAWWVEHDQVSKTAPSGEYLTTGSFMIRGKKNFLPPSALEMGFGILFKLGDDSLTRHLNEWKDKGVGADEDSVMDDSVIELEPTVDLNADDEENEEKVGLDEHVDPNEMDQRHERNAAPTISGLTSDSHAIAEQLPAVTAEEEEDESCKPQERAEVNDESSHPLLPTQVTDLEARDAQEEEIHEDTMDVTEERSGDLIGRRLTARERKLIKKFKTKGENVSVDQVRTLVKPQTHDKPNDPEIAEINKDEESEAKDVASSRGKKLRNKKKAKRYMEQDEEDKQLAMIALGHMKAESRAEESVKQTSLESSEIIERQQKAGVDVIQDNVAATLEALPENVKSTFQKMISDKMISLSDLDSYELRALAAMEEGPVNTVLKLFKEADVSRIGNKRGFLASLMQRVSHAATVAAEGVTDTDAEAEEKEDIAEGGDDGATELNTQLSRRARKKAEQDEIEALLKEEGLGDEAGTKMDELQRLTARPVPEDELLFAVPVCGPYASLTGYKFRVKLTPGTQKKGKAAKQAVEVFTSMKTCTLREKQLLKALSDPEMVAIMIGDVKLSVAGLQAAKANKKAKTKAKGKSRN